MHVVVCIKQVPDTTQVRVDPITNSLIREGMSTVVNPCDFAALECALTLKDRYGATITLITMGPTESVQALRMCLSHGADRAVLLLDPAFVGADALATSYALSAAIWRLTQDEPVDIVLCGKQSIDSGAGQTGPGIAAHLGWQQLTHCPGIEGVDVEKRLVVVERKLDRGIERVRTALPAVVTMVEDTPEIRYASLPGIIHALRYTPEVWTAQDLEVDPDVLGVQGSPTAVKRLTPPPQRECVEQVAVDAIGLETAVASAVRVMQQRDVL